MWRATSVIVSVSVRPYRIRVERARDKRRELVGAPQVLLAGVGQRLDSTVEAHAQLLGVAAQVEIASRRLKTFHHIVVPSAATVGTVSTGVDNVDLHRPI
jgi:hypothetical protein